jgi:type II secretory pathway pseudopilin PulG
MELMTVMVLVSILIVLTFPAFSYMRDRAERVKCVNNLHNLYAAGSAYVTDTNSWPQIVITDLEDPAYAQSWIDAFTPYQISRVNWICASIQRALGDPPYEDSAHARVDYIGSPFDNTPRAAMQWPEHPWFIERGNMHGEGNLIIFTNGAVKTLNEAKKDAIVLPPTTVN